MYAAYFGLGQEPFSIAPDPHYLYMSERHREALAHLLYGVNSGGGFVLLTGEIGTGKTTVCRCFLEQVPENCSVGYIFNPRLTVIELLRTICEEFSVPVHPAGETATIKECLDPLNTFLLDNHAAGRSSVLVIDEAQNLTAELLEQLRLLTNLETHERKLLQIVLIGQPELRSMLEQPELEQLAQRVIARYHLQALGEPDTGQYIRHRLNVAGLAGPLPFDDRAMARIHELTRGVPRRINLLCDRAMLGAYAHGLRTIDRKVVDQAADEVFGGFGHVHLPPPPRAREAALVGLGVLIGAIGAGFVAWNLGSAPAGPAVTVPAPSQTGAAPPPTVAAPGAAAAGSAPVASTAAPVVTSTPVSPPASAATASNAASAPAPASAAPAAASTTPPAASTTANASGTPAPYAWAQLSRDINPMWQALAPAWGLPAANSNPCETAATQQVQCFNMKRMDLNVLRRLNRPGIVTLHENADSDTPGYAILDNIRDEIVTLRTAQGVRTLPLADFNAAWRGGYSTFWITPPGYAGKLAEGSRGEPVAWLARRLAQVNKTRAPKLDDETARYDAALKAQVLKFQKSQGLNADGRAGALTLMQLGRATGVDEPRFGQSAGPTAAAGGAQGSR